MSSCRIHLLPDELLEDEIFGKLPLSSQWAAGSVCKRWESMLGGGRFKTRAPEEFIVLDGTNKLFFYSITQSRWLKPRSLDSLPPPLNSDWLLCGVTKGWFFFLDWRSNRVAAWNLATNKCQVLPEVQPVPCDHIDGRLRLGAFVNKETLEDIKFLAFVELAGENSFDDDAATGKLFWFEGGKWSNKYVVCFCCAPNFNNGNKTVVFIENGEDYYQVDEEDEDENDPPRGQVHLYDTENKSFTILREVWSDEGDPAHEDYEWKSTEYGGRFHFEQHGTYLVGINKFPTPREAQVHAHHVGILRFDVNAREWELVSVSPEGSLAGIGKEVCSDMCLLDVHYCSDGVENIWILPVVPRSVILRFNVASRVWTSFPSSLDCFGHYKTGSGLSYTTV